MSLFHADYFVDVRYWPKADICSLAPHMSAIGGKADIHLPQKSAFADAIGGKADMGWISCPTPFGGLPQVDTIPVLSARGRQ